MGDLPFTAEQFREVFQEYNLAIWPAQVIAYVLGLLAVTLAWRRRPGTDRLVPLVLSSFWLWTGVAYHILYFSPINPIANVFGAFFVVQGALLLIAGRHRLSFGFRRDGYGAAGALLIFYSAIVYPLLGTVSGHAWPYAPMFGVAPCPTTIFTFGLLLWTTKRVPGWLLAIPGAWALVGFTAAVKLGMLEDIGLLVAGVVSIAMLTVRNRRERSAMPPASE